MPDQAKSTEGKPQTQSTHNQSEQDYQDGQHISQYRAAARTYILRDQESVPNLSSLAVSYTLPDFGKLTSGAPCH